MVEFEAGPRPAQLIEQAREGDLRALGRLLEGYRAYVRLLAELQLDRHLQQKVDPSDLVQDVFLLVQRHFPDFRGASEPELLAWLRKILASCVSKSVRRYCSTQRRQVGLERTLHQELNRDSASLDQALVCEGSASRNAAAREMGVILANQLARLPEAYRQAVVLRHLEELSFPEIAIRMGRSVDSVKKLWARGLARLRDAYDDREESSV